MTELHRNLNVNESNESAKAFYSKNQGQKVVVNLINGEKLKGYLNGYQNTNSGEYYFVGEKDNREPEFDKQINLSLIGSIETEI